MKTLIISALLFTSAVGFCQQQLMKPTKVIPWVIVKDTTEKAYRYWCGHTNCLGGVGKEYVGIDTLRVYRTYVMLMKDSVMIDEKQFYLTKPKGSGDANFGDLWQRLENNDND